MAIRTALTALLLLATVAHAGPVERARTLLPAFERTLDRHWPQAPMTHIMCGQVEQESSWKPTAELKTSREYGFGLGQITITSRFNNFETARQISSLKNWKWEERFDPECQLTFLVFTDQANYNRLESMFDTSSDTWAASLVAYNAGMGTVLQRRRAAPASLKRRWFGGLELVILKSETGELYGRNLWKVRNEYPTKVFNKADKYRRLLRTRDLPQTP